MERKPVLLLIEDDPIILKALTQIFSGTYDVIFAATGEDGIALSSERPDLVLLDLNLPDMNGIDVCKRLLELDGLADMPVMFLTGDHDPITEERGINAGARDFVTKPFSAAVLRARVRTHIDLKRKTDQLKAMATRDGLTGVFNRRHFDTLLNDEWARMTRIRQPLSLLMADIDHFKNLNDSYGHQFGDDVLREVAQEIQNCIRRPGDHVGRYGGEEFGIILPSTDLSGARTVAETIRRHVHALSFELSGQPAITVSISLGCASFVPSIATTPATLVTAADRLLYRAKENGRNRVEWQSL